MQRALEVAADRGALHQALVALVAERPAESGQRSVGHHHVAGVDLALLVGGLVLDHRAAQQAVAVDGGQGLGALEQLGAAGLGLGGHHRVEVAPADDIAVAGVHRVLGPLHLEGDPVGDAAQAVVAVVVGRDLLLEAHVPQLGDGARGEAVAARLLAGEGLLLDDDDVAPGPGQPVGRGGARGAAADHQRVVAVGGHPTSVPGPRPGDRIIQGR